MMLSTLSLLQYVAIHTKQHGSGGCASTEAHRDDRRGATQT